MFIALVSTSANGSFYDISFSASTKCVSRDSETGDCNEYYTSVNGRASPTCFDGESSILTPTGYVKLSNMKTGDIVIGYDENKTKFFETKFVGFLHKEANTTANYLVVETNRGKFTVSGKHNVSTIKKNEITFIYAENLNIGDKMICINNHVCTISNITSKNSVGVYAPLVEYPFVIDGHVVHSFAHIDISDNIVRYIYEKVFFNIVKSLEFFYPDIHDIDSDNYIHPIARSIIKPDFTFEVGLVNNDISFVNSSGIDNIDSIRDIVKEYLRQISNN